MSITNMSTNRYGWTLDDVEIVLVGDLSSIRPAPALPEQHTPWIPHVTLVYTDDADLEMFVEKTGPVTFDKIRVVFGGDVYDIPLDGSNVNELTAAFDPDQPRDPNTGEWINDASDGITALSALSTIRDAASPNERKIAARLNDGGTIGNAGAVGKDLKKSILTFAVHPWGTDLEREIKDAYDDPNADTSGARLVRTVASASAVDKTLYRGMSEIPHNAMDHWSEGSEVNLGLSSFTTELRVAKRFAVGDTKKPVAVMRGKSEVVIELRPGARALDISRSSGDAGYGYRERVTMGRFRVVSRTVTSHQISGYDEEINGPLDLDVPVINLVIEQIG